MAELVWKDKYSLHDYGSARQQETAQFPLSSHAQLVTLEHFLPQGQERGLENGWENRLILGDRNLVLPELLPEFAGAVNLISIDPPFMTGRTFSNGAHVAYRDTWRNNLDVYLQWLYESLTQLYQLLAPTGSLYIHLDWRVSHYAKIILDEIFGFSPNANGPGFKNEIIWHYQSGGRSQKSYARKHDTILFYTKSAQYCFHGERIGERRGTHKRNHMRKQIGEGGRITWTIRSAGRIYTYDEDSLISPSDVWSDISHLHQKDPERTGYATQKPEALLKRILLASSEENDLVLDCFCGSGVMPAVAEQLGRRWIACDKSEMSITMTKQRLLLQNQRMPFALQHVSHEEIASGC